MYISRILPLTAALCALTLPSLAGQTIPMVAVPPDRPATVQGATKALRYRDLSSPVKIDLQGTTLSPDASGVAIVEGADGRIHVAATFTNLLPPSSLGREFLTYVLWGISPDGRATNLGEVAFKVGKAGLDITEGDKTFGLLVTAEPYFAVTRPSEAVVLENIVGSDAQGKVEMVEAKVALLRRGVYAKELASQSVPGVDELLPGEVFQARNALAAARAEGAPALAGETFGKAESGLKRAETEGNSEVGISMAREATRLAEDARVVAAQRQDLEPAGIRAGVQNETTDSGLRTELMAQLSNVLQTRETARGLVVSLSGKMFLAGKAVLSPAAQDKLAKIAGILSAHKGLKIEADGFTDSTGSDELNLSLSEKRAMVTKDFLVRQGVPADSIIFKGFGNDYPVAPNDTESGRLENRRVELVVTGDEPKESIEAP